MPSETQLDGILRRLRSNDLKVQYYGALMLSGRTECVELALDELIEAIDKASLSEEALESESRTPEKYTFTFGAKALSDFLTQPPNNLEAANTAKRHLLKLATSKFEWVTAIGIHYIGELRAAGKYAWDELLEACNGPGGEAAEGRLTLRALAYRAMLKIDATRTLALGEVPAKTELERVLQQSLAKHSTKANSANLQQELKALQQRP